MEKRFKSTAWILSLAGILPFTVPVFWLFFSNDDQELIERAHLYMVAYSAIILSFLGGIRWGASLNQHAVSTLVFSVLPSLFAWVCLLAPFQYQLVGLLIGFALQWFWDFQSSRNGHMPHWFGHLRTFISLCVVTLISLALISQYSG